MWAGVSGLGAIDIGNVVQGGSGVEQMNKGRYSGRIYTEKRGVVGVRPATAREDGTSLAVRDRVEIITWRIGGHGNG